MQLPKSIADIPFLSCSFGSISSEVNITAMKSEPLITVDEFTNAVILLVIWDLNSDADVVRSIDFNIQAFLSLSII